MKLRRPELDAPAPLVAALAARRTVRDIGPESVDEQALSNALFAAAAGLACWVHHCDAAALTRTLGLSDTQRVLLEQPLGHPLQPREVDASETE